MKTIAQKYFLKIIAIAFILSTFFSCTSEKKMLNSYIGQSENKLVQDFGEPYRTTRDTANGEVLIYNVHTIDPGTKRGFWTGKVHYDYYRFIYAHSDGTIYNWAVKDSSGYVEKKYGRVCSKQ